mmetsp:Transcript_7693/g.17732  ORF Transcript_7693/g.17732 Transcript_7693/m.17732 type:complete len:148 (-) Transcript_7693:637-1080(-)
MFVVFVFHRETSSGTATLKTRKKTAETPKTVCSAGMAKFFIQSLSLRICTCGNAQFHVAKQEGDDSLLSRCTPAGGDATGMAQKDAPVVLEPTFWNPLRGFTPFTIGRADRVGRVWNHRWNLPEKEREKMIFHRMKTTEEAHYVIHL